MSRLAGGNPEWLVAHLEYLFDLKLEQAELSAILADYDTGVAALESDIELIDGRLEVFEDDWWLVQLVEQQLDDKLATTALATILTAFDSDFQTLLSDIELLDGKLNTLETGLLQEL
jgi:hypothetical protein